MPMTRLAALLLTLAASPVSADWPAMSPDDFEELSGDEAVVEEPTWNGQVDVGFLASTGNTETSSLNSKLVLEYLLERWKHVGNISAVAASDAGITTAERYQAGYKAEYDLSEDDYVFGLLSYDKDRFSGVEQRTTEAVGYGRRLLHSETQVLDIEVGLGGAQIRRDDGSEENDLIGRLAGTYEWTITETASFTQTAALESGKSNTYVEATSSIKASLNDRLALSLGYSVKRNSDVPLGNEHTDTYTTVSLSYSF